MRASATLTAVAGAGGRTRLTDVRSEAPLVLRPTADAVYLAAGAAGPLGGDELDLAVSIGPGACLTVRTVAATLALPGRGESVLRLTLSVAGGARLSVLPEPTVVAAGARHRVVTTATVAAGGALVLREEVVLGRHAEPGGVYTGLSQVDFDGMPLLRHELTLDGADPATAGPASAVAARACGTLLTVDPAWATTPRPPSWSAPYAAALALAGPAVLVTAIADDARILRTRLTARPPDDGCWIR